MPFFSVFVLLFSVFVFFLVLLDPTFCCSLLAILLLLYPHDVSVCRSRAPPLLLVLLHLSVVEVGHVALLLRKDVKTTMASHLSFLLILNSTFFFFCLCASLSLVHLMSSRLSLPFGCYLLRSFVRLPTLSTGSISSPSLSLFLIVALSLSVGQHCLSSVVRPLPLSHCSTAIGRYAIGRAKC